MQTELLEKNNVSAKFAVEIPAEEVDKAYDGIVRSLARQIKVPGFRPGRAPRGIVETQVGKDAIAQEVRDALVERYVGPAVQELELQAIHVEPHAHEPVEGQNYRFEVSVDLYPEVTLPDIQNIVIDTAAEPLTDEIVNDTIEKLRSEHATLVPVERPAQAGDTVEIEAVHDGEPSGSTMPIDLEAVSPELGDQLVGKSIGDEVTLSFSAPPPQTAEGDEAAEEIPENKIHVIIRDVREKDKPSADDDFAKTLGLESWQETEEQIRKSLQAQFAQQAFSEQREEFVEKLVAESDFDIPRSLTERRKRQLLTNLSEQLREEGTTVEAYLGDLEAAGERDAFDKELSERAENDVKRDLVLEKLLEQRGTQVSDEELERALTYMAQQQRTNVAALKRQLGQQGTENYRFLLARDQTVREVVRELLGMDDADEADTADASEQSTGDGDARGEESSDESGA
ncbi:MAG: trigger factor [Trueperaceae bacterium]|nr:trigger factor [Trueperaceae bacterium]